MRKLLFVLLALLPFTAQAKIVHATPFTSAFLVDALLKAGVKLDRSKPAYVLAVKDIDCTYRQNQENTFDPMFSLWDYGCRNPNVSGAAAEILYNVFDKLEYVEKGDVFFGDCGMGKCEVETKSIRCTIDSAEMDHSKRFSCALDDME